jgi:hypothetical protein
MEIDLHAGLVARLAGRGFVVLCGLQIVVAAF